MAKNSVAMIIRGCLYLCVALYLLSVLCVAFSDAFLRMKIWLLPDYDYSEDVQNLYSQGLLSEAENLADFAITNLMASTNGKLVALREKIHAERTSVWGRVKRAGGGFAIGDENSPEEMIGAIASDMVLYGDVRDLIKQGYYKVKGRETDNVIIALSAIGVCTEFVDAIDWAPAVLKACRRVGGLTDRFAGMIISACKSSVKTRNLSENLVVAFRELRDLKSCAGVAQTVSAMKYVNHVDDLKLITKYSKQAPMPTSLMLKAEGLNGLRDLEYAGGRLAGCLKQAARAGKPGFVALRSYVKRVQRLERMVKAVPLVGKFLVWSVRNLPLVRWVVLILTAVFNLRGLWLIAHSVKKIKETYENSNC